MKPYTSSQFEDAPPAEKYAGVAGPLWAAWLILAILAVIPRFQFHLEIFRSIGFNLFVALCAALVTAGICAAIYIKLRMRGLWRVEPAILLGIVAVFGVIYNPLALAAVVWIAAVALACGGSALRAVKINPEPALAGLCGLGLLSSGMFVLGLAHGYRTGVLLPLMVGLTLVFHRSLREQIHAIRGIAKAWANAPELKSSSVGLAMFFSGILVIFACLVWLTPTWFGDSIQYHLPLVLSYWKSHSIAVPEVNGYGYYPQGFEVLAVLGYALGGQIAAQAIEPLFFLAGFAILIDIARACGMRRQWALIGAVLAFSTPFLHWTGVVLKNDVAMATFQLGALLCYFRWRESRDFRIILLGTFFVAMSFAVKYVALLGTVPLAILYVFALARTKNRFRWLAAGVAIFVLAGVGWPLRTYLIKGNMTYPRPVSQAVTVPSRAHAGGEPKILRFLLLPYRLFVEGKRYFESGTNTPLGIGLLLVAPLWFHRVRDPSTRRAERILWFFVALYYVYWALVGIVLRYAITLVMLLCLLAAARLGRMRPWSVNLCLAGTFIFSVPVLAIIELAPAHLPFFAKRIDASEFLRRSLPPYEAVHFVKEHVSPDTPIASVGDWAAGYAPDPSRFDHVYRNERIYTADDVKDLLTETDAGILILPNGANLGDLEAAARTYRTVERIHTDPDFNVYRLSPLKPSN